MNVKTTAIAIALTSLLLTGQAQVFTPPGNTGGGGSGGGGGGSNQTTIVNQGGQQQSNDSMIGNEVPFVSPAENTYQFNGQTFQINDNQIFRARFEKYLNTAEQTDEVTLAYRKAMREVLNALAPQNQSRNKMAEALARIQHVGSFEQDAGLSESVSNAVYRMFLARKNVHELKSLNEKLDRERQQLDWGFSGAIDRQRRIDAEHARRNRNVKGGVNSALPEGTENAGETARYVQRIAEKEAQRVANMAVIEVSEAQAKVEFQALIVQLFLQRRFEHVIMASRVYTEFFGDGSGKLEFDEGSEVEKTFSQSIGFSPTVTTLDAFSNEAIRDVKQQVESFLFLVEKGEIDGASLQLQQAFVTGEFLPAVQNVPREEKRKIVKYAQNAFKLTSAINVKDYTLAGELIAEMREQASDFDYSKPTAAVETAKLTSNMKLRTAKNAAIRGDNEAFEKNLAEATGIWPTNPAIKAEFDMLADSGDEQAEAVRRFDMLLGAQQYRQIFNSKFEFAAALAKDEERQKSLEQILTNVQEIDVVLKQADTLKNAGNGYAAWELVKETFQQYPDDVPLSAKLSTLTPDVADFASALTKAAELKEKGQKGSSLAWYLAARRIYPQSENAADGIKELVDAILPEG